MALIATTGLYMAVIYPEGPRTGTSLIRTANRRAEV